MEAVVTTGTVKKVDQDVVSGKRITAEPFIFLGVMLGFIGYLASFMGVSNLFSTIMKTAFDLLINTALFVMAVCVLTGALSALLAEFGVVDLLQKLLSPVMRPLFGLPGIASLAIITCFLSDNPAVLSMGKDKHIRCYFKKYEVAALTNLGTAFGMGLVVFTYMSGYGFVQSALAGIIACVVGSCVSTRLMLWMTKRHYQKVGRWEEQNQYDFSLESSQEDNGADADGPTEKQSVGARFMNAMLDGGKQGVENGMSNIPGILIVCTLIMLLTMGPSLAQDGTAVYTGKAYEGIALLPKLGEYLGPVVKVLFGFTNGSNIAFPITAMGAVGAALGTLPAMLSKGLVDANDIAVFTAIGMCYSGYLSTHVSMMDVLGKRELAGFAIMSHTVGGLVAGVAAHYIYLLLA